MKIHILGIAGTFMSAVAILAKKKGYEVTGSDTSCYDPIKSILEKKNIKVIDGHKIKDVKNKDLIIIGNIMSRGNSVIEYILKNNINYTSGPQWLYDNILKNKIVIAVSGTHGKTTTTSMIVHILRENKLNPSYLIGGSPKGKLKSVMLNKSDYFVIEADEYDTAFFDKRSKFIHYKPNILVINNIEYDHADIFNNVDEIIRSFHHMVRLLPSNGAAIVNNNDKNIKKLLDMGFWSRLETFNNKNKAANFNLLKKTDYILQHRGKNYKLPNNLIGEHNQLNATAAIAACKQLSIPISSQIKSLSTFQGVAKRTDFIGEIDGIKIFDDFAHHPTAIESSIKAIKERFKNKKILTVFIPGSNSMLLGAHNHRLVSSLNKSNKVLIISKMSQFKKLKANNIKISVIESETLIRHYLNRQNSIDIILILSNKNTTNIINSIKNG